MQELPKYYCRFSNKGLAISVILDPKLKLKAYETTQDAVALKEAAYAAVREVFDEYKMLYFTPLPKVPVQGPPRKKHRWENDDQDDQELRSELEQYLDAKQEPYGTDILEFWNKEINRTLYPTLCKMAQDFLAIQPTSKDIEGTFSRARRVIPYYRKKQTGNAIRDQMLANSGCKLGILNFE